MPINTEKDWNDLGEYFKDKLIEYDWQYRKKICIKCPLDIQKKLKCFRVDNFKDGIQETHCKKMDNARTQKFRKWIWMFISYHPNAKILNMKL